MKDTKSSARVCPREFFSVSDEVCHLTPQQLRCLEEAFDAWKESAKRADSKIGRARLWLAFILLRHTGAKLGEILSLDDRDCFEGDGATIDIGQGDRQRAIPLPEEVYIAAMKLLESPLARGLRGTFLHLDPGYFRRICYDRGRECGLSKEQVCPSSLRNTRAVEMLRNGVPITIVRDVLGQSSLDLTANFQQFSQGDIRTIVTTAHNTMRKQTSARNSFVGHVTSVKEDEVMAEVSLETRSGLQLSAVITANSLHKLKIQVGSPVIASVKAPLVNVVATADAPVGSARNRFTASVISTAKTLVMMEVVGRLEDESEICALIATSSGEALDLKNGDTIQFWFKALSVVLNTVQL